MPQQGRRIAAMEKKAPTLRLVPLSELRLADWNPRKISEDRLENLCRSIEADPEFLWRRPILAQADGTIYAGNQRYLAAQELGMEAVPALVEDVPDSVARERALRDNKQWGAWLEEELASMLEGLRSEGSELDLLGFEEAELQRLLDRLEREAGLGDPEDVPSLPEEPVTRTGDVWELGRHRLLCGDSTRKGDLARLMGSERASCVWTDPPYGVSYTGGTRERLTLQNDEAEGLDELLKRAFAAIDTVLVDGAALYVAHPAGALSITFGLRFLAQGWRLHQGLVWKKDSIVPGHCDYQYRHEGIIFGYKQGKGRRGRGARGWYGGNGASSVFEVARPKASPDHPTCKPVELVAAMVRNSSRTGEIVLDPFMGSGSTLIACEQLGRRCFGVEIDPRYADVAVRRWEAVAGAKAVKECGA